MCAQKALPAGLLEEVEATIEEMTKVVVDEDNLLYFFLKVAELWELLAPLYEQGAIVLHLELLGEPGPNTVGETATYEYCATQGAEVTFRVLVGDHIVYEDDGEIDDGFIQFDYTPELRDEMPYTIKIQAQAEMPGRGIRSEWITAEESVVLPEKTRPQLVIGDDLEGILSGQPFVTLVKTEPGTLVRCVIKNAAGISHQEDLIADPTGHVAFSYITPYLEAGSRLVYRFGAVAVDTDTPPNEVVTPTNWKFFMVVGH